MLRRQTNKLFEEMYSRRDASQVKGLMRFFKTGPGQYGEGDKFLGIKVPVTRAVVKSLWRECDLQMLEECIRSEYHEIRLAALLALVEIFNHAKKIPGMSGKTGARCPGRPAFSQEECIGFYLSHTAFINNWDLVDLSCYPLLGTWLLDRDRTLLYDLARSGKTLWEQRIGIVSTMQFIRHGELDDTFAIADILLHHPHDLIHKAVGWMLREAGKRDESALKRFLQESAPAVTPEPGQKPLPRYQAMPRTMLRYAIERFPEAERKQYLRIH
ncbi:MAG: DNA alkylation repair protein [Bacteroidales bacterium]|nr:DNA alkylation repair protein [Bacteroidales bacterium]